MLSSEEIRRIFIDFYVEHDHTEIAGASLVPAGDNTVLFTSAGMQPLVPHFDGVPHPGGARLVNVQRCLRTVDIDEVGDDTHLTLFEMLGVWSLGDYYKHEAIGWSVDLLTQRLGFDAERLCATVFAGDAGVQFDAEAYERAGPSWDFGRSASTVTGVRRTGGGHRARRVRAARTPRSFTGPRRRHRAMGLLSILVGSRSGTTCSSSTGSMTRAD